MPNSKQKKWIYGSTAIEHVFLNRRTNADLKRAAPELFFLCIDMRIEKPSPTGPLFLARARSSANVIVCSPPSAADVK
jgi:hypothetical protein